MLLRIWSVVRGPVSAILIITYFTPEAQGYYYTFTSILGVSIFIELGLGRVIIQFASHEWAKLRLNNKGTITGSSEALSRLVSLGRLVFRWYGVGSIIIILTSAVFGYFFFSQNANQEVVWLSPWLVLCLLSGANLFLVPFLSILEGCQMVSQVYRYRLLMALLGSFVVWAAIIGGANLWTAPISSALGLVLSCIFIFYFYWRFFQPFFSYSIKEKIDWRAEIFPMQWRIAISWVSGFFASNFLTPVIFHYHGAVLAGQMGMTWMAVMAVGSLAGAWVAPRAPDFGVLIAKKKYETLDKLFFKLVIITIFVAILGSFCLWTLIYLLDYFQHPFSVRFLPPLVTGIFLFSSMLGNISYPFTMYLRAHRKEPVYIVSIVSGFMNGFLIWFLGSIYGALGAAIGILATKLFSLTATIIIWNNCRSKWHINNKIHGAMVSKE